MEKITTVRLKEMKEKKEKITMLTCYNYSMAKLLNQAEIEVVLVGDSLGMVVLGYENTLPVTVEDILYHTKAVKRGNSKALLVADMPFLSYQVEIAEAIRNAGRMLKEGGAEAVKCEGGQEMAETIKALGRANIPVMGHLGLTPQAIHQLGGYKVQGRTNAAAKKLIAGAKILEDCGIFALVLECIPQMLAKEISRAVSVPTIGIGAGPDCDGQVLVLDDLLGLYGGTTAKFVKQYAKLNPTILQALAEYRQEVKKGQFPNEEHSYK